MKLYGFEEYIRSSWLLAAAFSSERAEQCSIKPCVAKIISVDGWDFFRNSSRMSTGRSTISIMRYAGLHKYF